MTLRGLTTMAGMAAVTADMHEDHAPEEAEIDDGRDGRDASNDQGSGDEAGRQPRHEPARSSGAGMARILQCRRPRMVRGLLNGMGVDVCGHDRLASNWIEIAWMGRA